MAVSASVTGIPSGTHVATFPLASPSVSNSPQTVTGHPDRAAADHRGLGDERQLLGTESLGASGTTTIAITNSGGGQLTGLTRTITFGGTASGG